jgi:hypothetical protein
MNGTWFTDATHFLNEQGGLNDMPGPAVSIAIFLRSIIGWVTMRNACVRERTNITCRRSPARRRCIGEIEACLFPDTGEIEYYCPECGDNGVIHGWRGGPWDRSPLQNPQTRDEQIAKPGFSTTSRGTE